MSVLIYAESWDGKFKKTSFQAISYGVDLANKMNSEAIAITINADSSDELYNYGVGKVIEVKDDSLSNFSANRFIA